MKPPPHSPPAGTDAQEIVRNFEMRELIAYFLRLGTFGFGGPIALVGYMQKDLVEERRWFSKDDYLQALAFCQLSPGPLAAQLAIYLGWIRASVWGGTLTGIAFILPSFLMVVLLAALYVRFGSLPWIQECFTELGLQSSRLSPEVPSSLYAPPWVRIGFCGSCSPQWQSPRRGRNQKLSGSSSHAGSLSC